MITIEQAKVIQAVLARFNSSEILEWTNLDDCMLWLSWLTDEQLVTEAVVTVDKQVGNNVRCDIEHPKEECFAPIALTAVSFIIEDFHTSNRLAKKARYVLEYYLSLCHTGAIISD